MATIHRSLSRWRLTLFALINVSLTAAVFPVTAYLPSYYADHGGLGLAIAGLVFTLSRIWNGLNDPLVGWWSDNTRSRFGRRKPWIAAGAPLYLIATAALFWPPVQPTAWYLGVWLFVFYLGWTMIAIPLAAWSGELSDDYHERSRVQAYLQTSGAVGLLLVLLVPAAVDWVGVVSPQVKLGAMGGFIALTLVPGLTALLFFHEPGLPREGDKSSAQTLQYRRVLKMFLDPMVARVMGSDFAVTFGQGVRSALLIFFVSAWVGLPQWASTLWLLQFAVAIFAAPLWLQLSYRLGKHRTVIAGELVQVAINLGLLAVGRGELTLLLALTIAQGLAQGSGNLMLRALVADVADAQRARHGEERAGLLFSIFSLTGSLGMAAAVALAFPLLAWLGFVPGQPNDAHALQGLHWLFAVGPAAAHAVSAWLVAGFPLDEKQHRELRAQLRQREAWSYSSLLFAGGEVFIGRTTLRDTHHSPARLRLLL